MDASVSRTPRFTLVAVFVCLAAAAIGVFFGAPAAMAYASGLYAMRGDRIEQMAQDWIINPTGRWVGAGSGLLVGLLWCRILIPRAIRDPRGWLVTIGCLYGVLAGLISTAILHAALTAAARHSEPIGIWLIGLACGVPAGAILGAIGGGMLPMGCQPSPAR